MDKLNSLITNRIFYLYDNDNENILKHLKNDGKIILVLHNLYLLTNRLNYANTNLKILIERCGYKVIKDNITTFWDILIKIKDLGVINFKNCKVDKNTLIEIDCSNLIQFDDGYFNFFKLDEEEINLIRSNSTNNQNFITNLKVYCYLKARVQKIDTDKDISERGYGQAEVTWRSFDDITKHTGVSAVEKSINKLRDIGLIKYVNPGYKTRDNKTTNCSNIYALNNVSKNIDMELVEGEKQYIYKQKEKGYKISKQKTKT